MAGSQPKHVDPEIVVEVTRLYGEHLKSTKQIAVLLGLPPSRVRTILLNVGVNLRSQSESLKIRGLGSHRRGKTFPMSEEHRIAIISARKKWAEKFARGVTLKPSGYIEYTRGPHKGRSVHRVIMETRLGRKLGFNEVVHHEDGSRANNEEANLRLMSRSEHTSLHRREGHHGRSE